jgi:hypothetical protein
MECLRQSFFLNESVCIGSEINKTVAAQKDLERLCIETAKDGVSVLARHKPSGKIVGVAFNKIQVVCNASTHNAEHKNDRFLYSNHQWLAKGASSMNSVTPALRKTPNSSCSS